MPQITLTSPETGLTHTIESDHNPTEADVEEAGRMLDAPVLHELENHDGSQPLTEKAFTAQLFQADQKGLLEKAGEMAKGVGEGAVDIGKTLVVSPIAGIAKEAGDISAGKPILNAAGDVSQSLVEGAARGGYGDLNLIRKIGSNLAGWKESHGLPLEKRAALLYPRYLENDAYEKTLAEASNGGRPLIDTGLGETNQDIANVASIPASPIGLMTGGVGKVGEALADNLIKKTATKIIAPVAGAVETAGRVGRNISSIPIKMAAKVGEKIEGTPFEHFDKVGAWAAAPLFAKPLAISAAVEGAGATTKAIAKEAGAEGMLNPMFRRIAQNEGNAPWLRKSADLLDQAGFTGRVAGSAIKGATIGGTAGAALGALSAQNPEELGQAIGSGIGLGGIGATIGHPLAKASAEAKVDDQIRSKFIEDQISKASQAGQDPDVYAQKLGKQLNEKTALQVGQLQQVLGDKADIHMVSGDEYAKQTGDSVGAAKWMQLPGGKSKILVNLDASGDINSNILHEVGHAFYNSSATDKGAIRSAISTVYTPEEMAGFRQKYAQGLADDVASKNGGTPRKATPDEVKAMENNLDQKHGPDWIYDELFADSFLKDTQNADLRKTLGQRGMLDDLSDKALALKTSFLSALGVPFDSSGKISQKPDLIFKNLKASPEMRAMIEGVIKDRNEYLNGSKDVNSEGKGVKISPQEIQNHPATPMTANPATGVVENDFGRVNPTTGRFEIKAASEIKAQDKLRIQQIAEKLYNSQVLPVSDPAFGKKVDAAGREYFGGRVLPDWFYQLSSFNPLTKGVALDLQNAMGNGHTFSGWYQGVGTGPTWSKVVSRLKGGLSASMREFVPMGFTFSEPGTSKISGRDVKSGGNMLVTVFDVEAAQKKVLRWAEEGKLHAMWNGDLNSFYGDLKKYMANHQADLPGDSNGIGAAKKNVLNHFFGGGNKEVESFNPLRTDEAWKDPQSLIKKFRLDRLQTVQDTGKTGWHTDYGKLLANFRPEGAQLAMEAVPGVSTGVGKEIQEQPLKERAEFTENIKSALMGKEGIDPAAKALGLNVAYGNDLLPGSYGGASNPFIPIAINNLEIGPDGKMTADARAKADAYVATLGRALAQESAGITRPVHGGLNFDSAFAKLGGAPTSNEIVKVNSDLEKAFGKDQAAVVATPEGIRVLNVGNAKLDDIILALQASLYNIKGNPINIFKFENDGNYIIGGPDGQGYSQIAKNYDSQRASAGQRPILEGASNDLQRRLSSVIQEQRKGLGLEPVEYQGTRYRPETLGEGTQAKDLADPLYSQLQKTIESSPQEKMTIGQLRGLLQKGGVKADELKWSGFDDLLKKGDNEKISKADVLKVAQENAVQIKEVMKGEKAPEDNAKKTYLNKRYNEITDEISSSKEKMELGEISRADHRLNLSRLANERDSVYSELNSLDRPVNGTKFSAYQLPGGENYRELLLTLPGSTLPDGWKIKETDDGKFGLYNENGSHIGNWPTRESAEKSQRNQTGGKGFFSSHFDEPNILAHIRFNEREVNGEKVLFLEEVQSDWHQKGRKDGYIGDEKYKTLPEGYKIEEQAPLDGLPRFSVFGPDGKRVSSRHFSKESAASEAINQLNMDARGSSGSSVPDAPFKKTWHELAMKRMLRYAAENGYDKLAWTTGEQQAERYDLSKQVDKISVAPRTDARTGEKSRSLLVKLPDGHALTIGVDQKGIVDFTGASNQEMKGKRLDEVIGKEMAEKVMSTEGNADYSGVDLKVGGEGMKGFYDKILPSFMDKYGKKWGAKVGEVEIPVRAEADIMNGDEGGEDILKAHSIDITPSMKKSVLEEGQPMFRPESATSTPISAKNAPQTPPLAKFRVPGKPLATSKSPDDKKRALAELAGP